MPRIKRFLAEAEGQTVPSYWDFSEVGSNEEATTEVTNLFDGLRAFDTPKPVRLMRRILEIATRPFSDDIVLDFFAGSASMADAVIRANVEDGGNRRYVIVQIAEATNPKADAAPSYETVSAISRDRLARVGRQVADQASAAGIDTGFRVLRVDTTNIADISTTADALGQGELAGAIDSVKPDRADEDLLFQVLLNWGLDLAESIAVEEVGGRRVLSVAEDALIACFANEVTDAVVRETAQRHPLRAVFLDAGFVSDAARINAEQIFREVSPETEVRTI